MQPVDSSLPVLSAEEVRVLGCLVEKELTVPDSYPLTLNSLLSACNQKTSREPVVDYDAATVEHALQSLKERGFVRVVSGAEHRVSKYKHDMPFMLRLNPAQTAVLTVLMLRGAQTVGEIRGRTDRMHSFASLEEVAETLRDLQDHSGRQLVTELERLPGTKEPRFAHLLSGEEAVTLQPVPGAVRSGTGPSRDLEALRGEVAALREELAQLRADFLALRRQFE
jgi:uncharacterized protein YceH (UPF0502 family)